MSRIVADYEGLYFFPKYVAFVYETSVWISFIVSLFRCCSAYVKQVTENMKSINKGLTNMDILGPILNTDIIRPNIKGSYD